MKPSGWTALFKRSLLVTAMLLVPGLLFGAEKFGMVFDVKGVVVLKNALRKLQLDKKKHILYPIRDGDTIVTGGDGSLLIVSLKRKNGYEVSPDSVVIIKGGQAKVLEGSAKEKEGLIASAGSKGTKVLGGQVMIAREAEVPGGSKTLPERLAHVFYLLDSGLEDEAQREIAALIKEFPENEYIGRLQVADSGNMEDNLFMDLESEIDELEEGGRVIEDIEE